MKISFVLPVVDMAGGIRVIAIYARKLVEFGHEVTLVSPPPQAPGLRQKVRALLKGRGWPAAAAPARSHLDGSGLAHRVLDSYRPVADRDLPDADVVVATWWETAEWVAALSPAKGAKAYFIQGHEVYDYLPRERCRATYRAPLHKITIARWLVDLMAAEYGDRQVDLVPNAVDHSLFFAAPRGKQTRPTIGFLYHETPLKGLDIALQAVDRLRARYPDLRVLAFGSHRSPGLFELPDGIEFHLSPPQHKIREIYAQCDVWLATSRCEGFNLTAMEAMACRTPLVSTRAGWPIEAVVDGINGRLVDVDDITGLVHGAAHFLDLPDTAWRTVSENAGRTVADCSWERSARLFEQALRNAGERSRRGELHERLVAA